MKRWFLLIVLVIGLSAAGTFALQTMSASNEPDLLSHLDKMGAPDTSEGPQPKIEFVSGGDTTYDFGIMSQRAEGTHTWMIKNTGEGDLVLKMESSTCSCTLAKFKNGEKAVVKPGEESPIDLQFETRENNGNYSKGATISTNDPKKPTFGLQVKGLVFPPVMTIPPDALNFSTLSNDEKENVGYVAVYSKDRPETKITKVSTSSKEIVAEATAMSVEDAKQLQIKEGQKVTVRVKPGLPLGFFKEEVVITTDHPKQPEVRIGVGGRMTGPISMMPNTVVMHQADGTNGSSSEISLVVRGSRPTKFEVVSKPAVLKVEIVPVEGKVGRYKLAVSVPPGSKVDKIVDEIVLKTDHPNASKVIIPVSVWILRGT